jgi:hypothetical protein
VRIDTETAGFEGRVRGSWSVSEGTAFTVIYDEDH